MRRSAVTQGRFRAISVLTKESAIYLLLMLVSLARAEGGESPRVPWKNTRLRGSPEPPAPFVVEKTFTRMEWRAPLYIAREYGTDYLWVVLQGGEADRPSRITRILDQPDAPAGDVVFQVPGRLIYGLTFHPGYVTNRWVYIFSNGPTVSENRTNRVSRYFVSRESPHHVDPAFERVILEWKSAGHDGGDLAFGKDGMLYITSGDGTSDSDGWDSGQDMSNLLASLIRIDVDHVSGDQTYAIPPDNPFIKLPDARPEIWAYGFRNPWRMCIDPENGDIWVGNNGQDLWETAYLVNRGDNFGWSVTEGSHPFHPGRKRGPTPIVPPTIEHPHSDFRSLTGGVVYYGEQFPELRGAYVYGDYGTGKIWGARHQEGRLTWHKELADTTLQIAAFRVSHRGQLLIVDHGGGIYQLMRRGPPKDLMPFPRKLSETGLFTSTTNHEAAPGVLSYSVNAPGWMDGATAERFLAVPDDATIEYRSSRGWEFPNGAVLVQTLFMPGHGPAQASEPRRLETRLLIKREGEWEPYSYAWDNDGADAVLVDKAGGEIILQPGDASGEVRPDIWKIPARSECMACHSRAANFVLGITGAQMNREHDGATVRTNQLLALAHMGVLSGFRGSPERVPRLINPYDEAGDLELRARSYLHANCSVCHVEAGGGNSRMELEFNRALKDMHLVESRPQHDSFGILNAMLVAPGEPDRSVLIHRLSVRGSGQMPPLVTREVDTRAVETFRRWISGLAPEMRFVRSWTMAEVVPAPGELGAVRSVAAGRRHFERLGCVQCHRHGDKGGVVGPDLTDVAERLSIEALIESIIEPSKVIAEEYATTDFETRGGDWFRGQIESEDEGEIVLRTSSTLEGPIRIARGDITARRPSGISNMPSGIVDVLQREEILDLVAYLLNREPR